MKRLLAANSFVLAALVFAGSGPEVSVESVRSRFELLEIDHAEEIERVEGSDLLYVRSVRKSESYTNTEGDVAELVTYVNGLYERHGGELTPVWEESGEDEDGFGRCQRGTSLPLDGGFNDCTPSTVYLDLLAGGSSELCVRSDWSPYRGTNTTLRCFDLARPGNPILSLDTKRILRIRRDGNALEVDVIGWPRAETYVMRFTFDEPSHAFRLEREGYEEPERLGGDRGHRDG